MAELGRDLWLEARILQLEIPEAHRHLSVSTGM